MTGKTYPKETPMPKQSHPSPLKCKMLTIATINCWQNRFNF